MAQHLELGLDTFGDVTRGVDGEPVSYPQVIRNVIEEAVLADSLGVDFFGIGEHHRSDFSVSSPEMVLSIEDRVPDPEREKDDVKRGAMERALTYMALEPNKAIADIRIDKVFIGSCTNSRIEDLRDAAAVVRKVGGRIASNVRLALVVPGSGLVKEQAEREGLDKIFTGAGFEWREPGCSMCLAMNPDKLSPEERCASTSNRNFEGRQGFKGRTHLVSPAMAAAAAIAGHFVDIRDWR